MKEYEYCKYAEIKGTHGKIIVGRYFNRVTIKTTPHTLKECCNMSCTICSFVNETIYGYGNHIDGAPFPLYDFSRCEHKQLLISENIKLTHEPPSTPKSHETP